ncbi:hypothetical protein BH20ACT2_BH20ACT2_15520 [soil metagenome]
MAAPAELIEFRDDDRAVVVARMSELSRDRDGWLNLSPEVDEDAEPAAGGGLFSVLGARRPAVPLLPWLPGRNGRKGREPITVGIQHGVGARVAGRLVDAGAPVPDGWAVLQDNPRRGLVVEIPEHADHDAALVWLTRAAAALCTAPFTGHWLAEVHHRR